jgi:hypothetical protein
MIEKRWWIPFVAVFVSLSSTAAGVVPIPSAAIVPWFCLQRCGYNASQSRSHLDQIVVLSRDANPVRVEAVAFELYNLGPNGTLIVNSLFDINDYIMRNETLSALVRTRIAMISSYPYPPQFLAWMRELFLNPTPFIAALLRDLDMKGIDGVNVDFEPTAAATQADAVAYNKFLVLLKNTLAAKRKIVTVAAATWSNIWNMSGLAVALGPTPESFGLSGYVTSMNTYTYDNAIFQKELEFNLLSFAGGGKGGLLVGLETWPTIFTEHELKFHYELLEQHNICQIAIWSSPIPLPMIPYLQNFTRRCFF